MKLSFLGATQTVTGSKYLLEHNNKKIMVDCGLFQGFKELRLRNWAPLPIKPSEIDAILLTHAHIDHSGYIPVLVKKGFKGKVYCTEATFDLCSILLPDSGYLQEEETRRANKYGYSKHSPAKPLYGQQDAIKALEFFEPMKLNTPKQLGENFNFNLRRSGHILGASFIEVSFNDRVIVFSGDLGRDNDPVIRAPVHIKHADYLVIESTYGDRLHPRTDPHDEIAEVITSTIGKGGTLVLPAFAVGRTQSLLCYIYELKQAGIIPDVRVFLDSPMATNATNLLYHHLAEHRLSKEKCEDVCSSVTYTKTVEESKALAHQPMPSIIISASGMATGGRVLHHLKSHIGDSRNTILFTGFQAGGTRGDRLLKGEKEIKIHGEMWPVRARIECLSNTSAHADYEEILTWLGHFKNPPRKVFVTHGEIKAAASMKGKIIEKFGWKVITPDYLQTVKLN